MDAYNCEFTRLLSSSGWPQKKAAAELGVDPATVSRYVAGSVKPSITILRLLAARVGESLRLEGEPRGEQPMGNDGFDRNERDLIETIRGLPLAIRKPFTEQIRSAAHLLNSALNHGSNNTGSKITAELLSAQIDAVRSSVGIAVDDHAAQKSVPGVRRPTESEPRPTPTLHQHVNPRRKR